MTIFCNPGKVRYTRKPQAKVVQAETAVPQHIDLQELAEGLGKGLSVRPAACYGMGDADFVSQQLFMVDVDNKGAEKHIPGAGLLKPDEALRIAEQAGYKPCFAYYTFSNTEQLPKFRVCFLLNHAVTDAEARNAIHNKLAGLFSAYYKAVDTSVCNPARVFYGGKSGLFYADYGAVLSLESFGLNNLPQGEQKPKKAPQKALKPGLVDEDVIQAIQDHDTSYIRSKFGYKETRIFDNRDQFFSWLYRDLNLAELLGVKEGQPFRCVLHDDHDPSANVFRSKKSGYWLYKCFSESCEYGGTAWTVKHLIEALGNWQSEYAGLQWIKQAFNVGIAVSAWSTEQHENIDFIIGALGRLSGETSFAELCPVANRNIKHCKALYIQILTLARECIFPDRMPKSGDNIIFYMSFDQIALAASKNRKRSIQYTKMLLYHKLLDIVPDSAVPKQFLQKAIAGSKNRHHHVQFYMIPSFVTEKLKEIEAQGQRWKEYGYRISGISYECFFRTEGAEVARRLYPQTGQYTDKAGKVHAKQIGKAAEGLHDEITLRIMEQVTSRGYTTEADVVASFPADQADRIREQLKKSISEIMQAYGLQKKRANKEDKTRFGMEGEGYPAIIIPEE